MSSYYRLKVIRFKEFKWKHPLHFKNPNLYVEVKLGDITRKAHVAKRSRSSVWNEELALSYAEFLALQQERLQSLKLKLSTARLMQDPHIGVVVVKLVNLLADSAESEGNEMSAP
ncbi:hypothetical protein ACEPAH_2300 [Sanghuangporus vaninii]